MAKAEITEVLDVGIEALYAAITKYEDYPKFVDGVKSVKVERSDKGGKTRVFYKTNIVKDVEYSIDVKEDLKKKTIKWSLHESDTFNVNNGEWVLKSKGETQTEAHYSLELEFKVPVPSFILNRLIKGTLPSMLKAFEKKALKK